MAVLPYKPTTVDGQLVPPPQRQSVEPPIQAMTIAMAQSDTDMKATTGIYEAGLGQIGPEQSGRAILARQQKSEIANFNFTDNLGRAIRAAGRQIVDLIQKVYDTGRVVRIVKPDGRQELVQINEMFSENGQPKKYDVTIGRYDVSITVGPSYQSKRQEFVTSVLSLVNSNPQLFPMVGDLLVRNMDWPGATEIADRLQKMLPPALQPEGTQPQVDPAAVQQLQQLVQTLGAKVKELEQGDSVKIQLERMRLESAERRNTESNIAGILKAEIGSKSSEAAVLAKMDHDGVVADLEHRRDLLHSALTLEQESQTEQLQQAHEQAMQISDQQHQQAMAQAQQQHEAQMQASAQPPDQGADQGGDQSGDAGQ
jgi:hypothetical protein